MEAAVRRFAAVMGVFVLCVTTFCSNGAASASGDSATGPEPPRVRIVYSRLIGRWVPGADTSGHYDLFLLCPGSSAKPEQLTSRDDNLGPVVWYPQLSPDGNAVLFVANDAGSTMDIDLIDSPIYRMLGTNLWVLALSSHKIKRLTIDGSGYHLISWAPDGKQAAAVQYGYPPYDEIAVWDLESNKCRSVSKRPKQDKEVLTDLFWSPSGAELCFQRSTQERPADPNLYAVARTGRSAKVRVQGEGERTDYSFSPDGKRLAFIQGDTVYVSNAGGSGAQQAVKMAGSATRSRPSWSSKGQLALAQTTRNEHTQAYTTELHVWDSSPKSQRKVASVPYNVTETRWSRDGKWLFLKVNQTGHTERQDPNTGWYLFRREGLLAIRVEDGHLEVLKQPNEETKGLDWSETNR